MHISQFHREIEELGEKMNSKNENISIEEWRKHVESGQSRRDLDHYINVDRYKLDIWGGKGYQEDAIVVRERLEQGIPAFELFHEVGLVETKSEARRLIKQGGAYCNSERVKSFDMRITTQHIINNEIMLGAGKKRKKRILVR